jgi:hypothetical protein
MFNFILCENFFNHGDFHNFSELVKSYEIEDWHEKEYGQELENFRLIPDIMEPAFRNILGNDNVHIIRNQSGFFRKPHNCLIHHESFASLNEWSFSICYEETTFNLLKHNSGVTSALQETNLNYKNFLNWDYYLNVLLKPGQGILYRPWLFHSLERGIVQYFKVSY